MIAGCVQISVFKVTNELYLTKKKNCEEEKKRIANTKRKIKKKKNLKKELKVESFFFSPKSVSTWK
jgi:hypothetical protein